MRQLFTVLMQQLVRPRMCWYNSKLNEDFDQQSEIFMCTQFLICWNLELHFEYQRNNICGKVRLSAVYECSSVFLSLFLSTFLVLHSFLLAPVCAQRFNSFTFSHFLHPYLTCALSSRLLCYCCEWGYNSCCVAGHIVLPVRFKAERLWIKTNITNRSVMVLLFC